VRQVIMCPSCALASLRLAGSVGRRAQSLGAEVAAAALALPEGALAALVGA
jgi:hypothetical protein